jgi:methionyl-tRNA synthetase
MPSRVVLPRTDRLQPLARYWRLREPTFLLTGTDEHATRSSHRSQAGTTREFVDRIAKTFRDTWDACGISYDHFVRTTDANHVRVVRDILQRVHANGDIYFDSYGGLYCTGCERYYTERESVKGNCPEHQQPLERIEEENYFFRMSKYQEPWLRYLEERPERSCPGLSQRVLRCCAAMPSATCASRARKPACRGASSCRSTPTSSPTFGSMRCSATSAA